MLSKVKKNGLLICIILLLFFMWRAYSSHVELNEFKNQVIKLKDGEQLFVEKINEQGLKIAEQDQIILTQKDAIAHNLLEISNLKKVNTQVTIKTITKIDSIYIPIIDTGFGIICDRSDRIF